MEEVLIKPGGIDFRIENWRITKVIPFYFNFGSNLIISVLVEAYSLVAGLSL